MLERRVLFSSALVATILPAEVCAPPHPLTVRTSLVRWHGGAGPAGHRRDFSKKIAMTTTIRGLLRSAASLRRLQFSTRLGVAFCGCARTVGGRAAVSVQ